MQKIYTLLLSFSLIFILTACSDNSDNTSKAEKQNSQTGEQKSTNITETSNASASSSDSKDYGDKLVMASIGEPSNLIPFLSTDSASHEIASMLFIAPLKYDENIEIVPFAAKTWEILDEGKHFKFELRDDILWEDGTPFTADDVTFTYNLMIDPNTPTAYAADFLLVKQYKQTGKYTFEVFYDAPYARSAITWMQSIMPKHILENQNITRTDFARKPIGAGPFKLTQWETGSRLTLEANDKYFEGRPFVNSIIYRIIPDTSTIFLEAKNKAVDYLNLTPQQFLKQTNGPEWDAKWQKFKYLAFGYTYLGFNLNNALFQDKNVRQALSYAIDRQAIVDSTLLGLGVPAIGPYKPTTWVYNENLKPYPLDREKAKTLMQEAGWTDSNKDGILDKDGINFSFTVLTNQGNDERIKTATIMQSYFKEIGVEMKIRTVEWTAFINEFVNKGNYDAIILAWNILQDPDLFDVWHSSNNQEGGLNFINYKNSEVDTLLVEARALVDENKRKELYDRFQEILHEEQPYLFLYVPYSLSMVQSRFHGIKEAPAGIDYNIPKWYVPKNLQLYK